jgi:hypothetical protein
MGEERHEEENMKKKKEEKIWKREKEERQELGDDQIQKTGEKGEKGGRDQK